MNQWLVIGISGVTCGGKTTLATNLFQYFKAHQNEQILTSNYILNEILLISQDNYFLQETDPRHQIVQQLNHVNYEILSALDMDKMIFDIGTILKDEKYLFHSPKSTIAATNCLTPASPRAFQEKLNILLIEGFLIFNQPQLMEIFNLRFYIHLPYEKCYQRRIKRTYEPPDIIGYFEICVWPYYEKHFSELKERKDIYMLNGEISKERLLKFVLNCINEIL